VADDLVSGKESDAWIIESAQRNALPVSASGGVKSTCSTSFSSSFCHTRDDALGFLETGATTGPRELPGTSCLSDVAALWRGEIAVHFARVTTKCTQALCVRYRDLASIAHQRDNRHQVGHHEAPGAPSRLHERLAESALWDQRQATAAKRDRG
jgi:hypothetical protein